VKRNLDWLTDNGVTVMPAGEGHLACGTSGPGRLPEPEEIAAFLENFFAAAEGDLRGKTILVTAGGTREAIDPVRFIGNRSSGKMGYAIAKDAVLRGAKVILISGPTALPRPAGVEFVPVISTQDMLDAVLKYFDTVDVVIKAAAVADFKPQQKAAQKIKKTGDDTLNIVLDKNPDILKLLGQRKNNQVLVGFAAETEHLMENAGAKVKSKNLDMIVANDVSQAGAGFNTDTNIVKFLFPDGKVENLEMMSKEAVGQRILDIVRDKLL
jgi:phosphopantothenoylcysteine decarboxylase/phosphopantothenate--cysteine ligase